MTNSLCMAVKGSVDANSQNISQEAAKFIEQNIHEYLN